MKLNNNLKLIYYYIKSKYFDFIYYVKYFFRYLYFKLLTIEGKTSLIQKLKYKISIIQYKEYVCNLDGDDISAIHWSLENLKYLTHLVEYYQILKYSEDEIKTELIKIRNDDLN